MKKPVTPSVVDTGTLLAPSFSPDLAGRTDLGQRRKVNEDQFLIADLSKSLDVVASSTNVETERALTRTSQAHLLLVADGMGGMGAGDTASDVVVQSLARYAVHCMDWFQPGASDDAAIADNLLEAVMLCQLRLQRVAERKPETKGMGTTLTLGYLDNEQLYVVHVGDSRCYILRDGALAQVTTDHTVAEQLAGQGLIDRGSETYKRYDHVLWNAVATSDSSSGKLRPDIHRAKVQRQDTILLCSDGLTGHLDDAQIKELLAAAPNSAAACDALVDAANAAGGHDNITCIVARIP